MKRTVGGSEVAQWVKVFVNPQDRSEPQTETQTDTETDRQQEHTCFAVQVEHTTLKQLCFLLLSGHSMGHHK